MQKLNQNLLSLPNNSLKANDVYDMIVGYALCLRNTIRGKNLCPTNSEIIQDAEEAHSSYPIMGHQQNNFKRFLDLNSAGYEGAKRKLRDELVSNINKKRDAVKNRMKHLFSCESKEFDPEKYDDYPNDYVIAFETLAEWANQQLEQMGESLYQASHIKLAVSLLSKAAALYNDNDNARKTIVDKLIDRWLDLLLLVLEATTEIGKPDLNSEKLFLTMKPFRNPLSFSDDEWKIFTKVYKHCAVIRTPALIGLIIDGVVLHDEENKEPTIREPEYEIHGLVGQWLGELDISPPDSDRKDKIEKALYLLFDILAASFVCRNTIYTKHGDEQKVIENMKYWLRCLDGVKERMLDSAEQETRAKFRVQLDMLGKYIKEKLLTYMDKYHREKNRQRNDDIIDEFSSYPVPSENMLRRLQTMKCKINEILEQNSKDTRKVIEEEE